MPQFWQIDPTRWINPAHIVYVEDYPNEDQPTLWATMVATESGMGRDRSEPYTLDLDGEAREKFLAYLARETEPAPPPAPACG
jgi:hypothetical protein